MKVEIQHHGSVTVVVPRDALSESTLDELRVALADDSAQTGMRLVLDMSNVTYVDSAGIEFLLELAGDSAAGPLRPRLAGLTDTVREAFYLTDTQRRFQVFDSVDGAVRSYV